MRKLLGIISLFLLISSVLSPIGVRAKSQIDIVFIIDRSGSMGDDINAVKNNVGDFANMLEQEGIDYQLGLLTYERSVTKYPLTSDVEEFKNNLGRINVGGSIENGLDAIAKAINEYAFELNSTKYFVIIGDERIYSNGNRYSDGEIIQMLNDNDIILTEISTYSSRLRGGGNFYSHTGGQFLSIYEDFAVNLTEIFEQIQAIPTLEVISPSPNQYLSELDTAFVPKVNVSDPDSDTLSFSYFIDSETTPRDTKTVTNTQTAQTVSFDAINIGTLTEGKHRMVFKVDDGTDTVQDYVDFYVDKTPPALGSVSATPTDTSIRVTGSASDGTAGLADAPYRYHIGSSSSSWTTQTSYALNSLTPNTKYLVRFEAKDSVGHIATWKKYLFTQAQIPGVSITDNSENNLTMRLNDHNPSGTDYQIKVGSRYVNSDGTLTSSPVWITPGGKQIQITGLTPNTSYSIQARARNHEGVVTSYSSSVTGTTLVPPPADISTEVEQRTITLTWPSTSGVNAYHIEVDGAVIDNGTSTTYIHSGLEPNTQHTYRVRVVNDGGAGKWSSLLRVTTLPDPPATPVNVQAEESQTEVTLTWDEVVDATAYDVEVDGTVIENLTETTYLHQGLEPETEHTYRVRAKNRGGISAWSQAVTVVTLPYPPETPGNITTEITKNSVLISWDPVEGADAYEIEVDGLIVDNGQQTSYYHEGLEPLSGHTYKIRAKNRGGKSPWSEPLDITTYPEEPDQPSNVMTTAGETEITVTWYKVLHAESYEVEIDGQDIVVVTEPRYTHKNLQPDSRHTYRVRAKNISGYSEWSSPVTMRTFPKGDGTMSLTNIVAVVTNTDITISWDTVAPDAQYEVEVDGVITDNGTNTIYHHGNLGPNEYHSYRIRFKNPDGSGDWVAVLSLSTLPNPPDAPTEIQAYATNNTIELRWERVEGATAYEVEIDGETVEVGNNTRYTHEGLTPGTSHTYRVRAKNETGVTAWSPSIVESTTSPTYTVKAEQGKVFDFTLLASNVQDFSEHTFVVTYDPNEVELVDLYNFTPEQDVVSEGPIEGTNMSVKHTPGRIEITVNQNVVPGTSWSGEITTLEFKSKIDGETRIDFVVE
ncbi:MAG: VWA domain-containing protein [Bacillaceae bacterium]|nr:VWA domain-containing protein [Bacillaceae bacterium]